MKPLNLYSLYLISERYDINKCNNFINGLQKNNYSQFKLQELKGIDILVKNILDKSQNFRLLNNFFVGFKIKQISKEFDLLKIDDKTVLNIELKSQSSLPIMTKQLKHNQFYLEMIRSRMILISYNTTEDRIYRLINNEMIEINIEDLICILNEMKDHEIDLENMFKPINYLISPLNSPERFLEKAYFLTDAQVEIKQKIDTHISNHQESRIVIEGQPGTGKTLLTFDIGLSYSKVRKVCIVHCGIVSGGHSYIDKNSPIDVFPIKKLKSIDISKYSLVIIDEAQRIFSQHWEYIQNKILSLNNIVIFSLDPDQVMSNRESLDNTTIKIKQIKDIQQYKLTNKIRTNPSVSNFVKVLMDTSKREKIKDTSSIYLYTSRNNDQTVNLIRILTSSGFEYIKFTPSNYKLGHMDKMPNAINSHQVIGQEFDNVVIIINDDFYYERNILKSKPHPNPNFIYVKLLYQSATRARSNLAIIVENNSDIFNTLLNLLL